MAAGEPTQDLQALREHISARGAAILRIGGTLDVTAVLQAIVDRARALTGGRYGVITTIDDVGQVEEFVSSGFTAEEHAEFAAWRDGPRLGEHSPATFRDRCPADRPAFLRSFARL